MTSMGERGYRSIGEVLAEVQDEFPDITISKIRFLESQGLIDPERTPSGYRKFYDHDVTRLRAILRSQREEYLPLKVIRDRLGREATDLADVAVSPEPTAPRRVSGESASARPELRSVPNASGPGPVASHVSSSGPSAFHPSSRVPRTPEKADKPEKIEKPEKAERVVEEYASLRELSIATDLEEATLRELESYGLLKPTEAGRESFYGTEAVAICRAARPLLALGLEPRHLRMYRTTADREVDLYEQIVLPLLKQRNPQARSDAKDRLVALAEAGSQLHAALVLQLLSRLG
jgi:DNA-binding transcriptional MerR regulator